MQENKELRRARNCALRLLKVRARSEKELIFRLKYKKFNQDVIDLVIGWLKKLRYIDDVSFANSWVRERINRPLGLKRLEFELKQKGIEKEIRDSVLNKIREQYSEYETVSKLVKDKFGKIINKSRPFTESSKQDSKKGCDKEIDYKIKRKIQGYLLRRGFSPDVVIDAIDDL